MPVGYPTGGQGGTDIATGDFNGDGRTDLLISNGGTPSYTLLLSKGDRTFTTKITYPEFTGGGQMVTGDFNKDGKLDFAYTGFNSVIVMPGLGDGTFAYAYLASTEVPVAFMTKGDFDGDGRLDLAVSRNYCTATCNSSIGVFFNTTSAANPLPTPTPTPRPTPTPTPPPLNFTIKGTVSNDFGGMHGVEMVLSGSKSITTRTVQGAFQFNLLPVGGTYTITPRGKGYNYTPASKTFTNLNGDAVVNFTSTDPLPMTNVNSSNYRLDEMAFESIGSLFGAHLSSVSGLATTLPLPTDINGTSVHVIDSLGVDRVAPLFYVSQKQINYQIPVGTAPGSAWVYTASADGVASGCAVNIVQVAPGFFSANGSGSGYAAADVQRVKADGTQAYDHLMQYDPAQNSIVAFPIDLGAAGDQVYLILYGTGLRFRTSIGKVTATVGGQAATVTCAGLQPQFAGVDQVNVLLPKSLKGAGDVDVAITFDGKAANTVKAKIK